MGMGDVRDKVIPKFALLSKSCNGGTITSRYFTPKTCHETHAATGTNCIAAACLIKGTVAAKIANVKYEDEYKVVLEHPLGSIECIVNTSSFHYYRVSTQRQGRSGLGLHWNFLRNGYL